jgi:ankyrin repeat protein
MVKQLVAHGAKVEISDNWGWTPLHMAAFHGYEDVIRSLLEAGANVCAAIKEWNDNKVSIVGGPSLEGWAGIPSISQRL